jgi:hypothetical protein
MAQKQIAPTTQIIKTPIKTESIAIPSAGAVTTAVRAIPDKKARGPALVREFRLTRRAGAQPQKTTQSGTPALS